MFALRQIKQQIGPWTKRHYRQFSCTTRAIKTNMASPILTGSRERVSQQLQLQTSAPDTPTLIYPVYKNASLEIVPGNSIANWARVNSFKAKPGEVLMVPNELGSLAYVVLGLGDSAKDAAAAKGDADVMWAYAALPGKLPAGTYSLAPGMGHADQALLGWMLGESSARLVNH